MDFRKHKEALGAKSFFHQTVFQRGWGLVEEIPTPGWRRALGKIWKGRERGVPIAILENRKKKNIKGFYAESKYLIFE